LLHALRRGHLFRRATVDPLDGEDRLLRIVPLKEDEMPKLSGKATERICPACDGTGFKAVKQPAQPGRRIYPARCEACDGKGRKPNPK
jgi:hypothetical protein